MVSVSAPADVDWHIGVALPQPLQQAGCLAAVGLGDTDRAMASANIKGDEEGAVAECGVLAAAAARANKENRTAAAIELLFGLAGSMRRAAEADPDLAARRSRLAQSVAQVEKAVQLLLAQCGPALVPQVVSVCLDQATHYAGTDYSIGGRRLLHHAAALCDQVRDASERERWRACVWRCLALLAAGSDRSVPLAERIAWQASAIDCMAAEPVMRFEALMRLGDLYAQSGAVQEAGRAYLACLDWFRNGTAATGRDDAGMALAWRLVWFGEEAEDQSTMVSGAHLGAECSARAAKAAGSAMRAELRSEMNLAASGQKASDTLLFARVPAAFHAVRFVLIAGRVTQDAPDADALLLLREVCRVTQSGPLEPTTVGPDTGFEDPLDAERAEWFPWTTAPFDTGAKRACARWRGLMRQAAELPHPLVPDEAKDTATVA